LGCRCLSYPWLHIKRGSEAAVLDALPPNVGLEVWNDAVPLGYDRDDFTAIQEITRSLARQHRYVMKDKLDQYDFFSVWEDDMYITANHIQYFLDFSKEIDELKIEAELKKSKPTKNAITGPLSSEQLERVFPGFIRVEVLKRDSKSQSVLDPIEVDLLFPNAHDNDAELERKNVNPEQCCFIPVTNRALSKRLPTHPTYDELITWEVGIKGYSVREFPAGSSFGWVALQPGPSDAKEAEINGYWSGSNNALGNERKPSSGDPSLFGQQGGFMATRAQIDKFERLCERGFLPPFDKHRDDGLFRMNVEYWSGGFQLWNGGSYGCNFQRIMVLEPEGFSKHLIYHTANNKQSVISNERIVSVNNLMGQLNSVKKAAINSMK